jgi:hypothetical protein
MQQILWSFLCSSSKHYNCSKIIIYFSAWIEESQIKPYFEFKDQLIKSNKSGAFKDALQAIEDFIKSSGDVSTYLNYRHLVPSQRKSIYSFRCDWFIVNTQITLHVLACLGHLQKFNQH